MHDKLVRDSERASIRGRSPVLVGVAPKSYRYGAKRGSDELIRNGFAKTPAVGLPASASFSVPGRDNAQLQEARWALQTSGSRGSCIFLQNIVGRREFICVEQTIGQPMLQRESCPQHLRCNMPWHIHDNADNVTPTLHTVEVHPCSLYSK